MAYLSLSGLSGLSGNAIAAYQAYITAGEAARSQIISGQRSLDANLAKIEQLFQQAQAMVSQAQDLAASSTSPIVTNSITRVNDAAAKLETILNTAQSKYDSAQGKINSIGYDVSLPLLDINTVGGSCPDPDRCDQNVAMKVSNAAPAILADISAVQAASSQANSVYAQITAAAKQIQNIVSQEQQAASLAAARQQQQAMLEQQKQLQQQYLEQQAAAQQAAMQQQLLQMQYQQQAAALAPPAPMPSYTPPAPAPTPDYSSYNPYATSYFPPAQYNGSSDVTYADPNAIFASMSAPTQYAPSVTYTQPAAPSYYVQPQAPAPQPMAPAPQPAPAPAPAPAPTQQQYDPLSNLFTELPSDWLSAESASWQNSNSLWGMRGLRGMGDASAVAPVTSQAQPGQPGLTQQDIANFQAIAHAFAPDKVPAPMSAQPPVQPPKTEWLTPGNMLIGAGVGYLAYKMLVK